MLRICMKTKMIGAKNLLKKHLLCRGMVRPDFALKNLFVKTEEAVHKSRRQRDRSLKKKRKVSSQKMCRWKKPLEVKLNEILLCSPTMAMSTARIAACRFCVNFVANLKYQAVAAKNRC